MDSRDFRKTWLQLQESWTEEADVNVNSTKAEKLQEKRKLPDALKNHQFKKKGAEDAKSEKKDDKAPEKKDKKEADNSDKKPSFLNKKATEGKKVVKVIKKVKEDGAASAGGATTSSAVGGAAGTCPDAHIGSPDRLHKRKLPGKVVTAKESKLFSHFKRFMAEAGLPVDMEAPVNDVAADAVGELTGEEPVIDHAIDAPADDAVSVLADIQARFPGKKIHICVESEPTEPFSAEDVAAAEAAIATVPEEAGLEGDMGAEEMLGAEGGEMPVDQDLADETKVESCSMREDEEEDMGAADGVEEIPTGAEIGGELGAEGGEELGDELDTEAGSEASPEMISLTPEQWTEFLAGGSEEEGLGDELVGATDVADAGEGDDSDSGRTKVQIRSASNTYAVGTYLNKPWTAKRVDGSWKLKTRVELTPGAKANIAHQINRFLETGDDV